MAKAKGTDAKDGGAGGVAGALRVGPGAVDLAAIDPRGTPGLPDSKDVRRDPKAWAAAQVEAIGADLAGLQERLFAAGRGEDPRRVLLVLQAMDCGGKDGTVKHVAGTMNPLGLRIVAFGRPTPEELRHHFLWRVRRAVPPPGYLGVFNRSHYEDVLVARVEGLVAPEVWQRRYDGINRFESTLAADGVTLLKVMLHVSKDEQKQRLADRLADPTKYWKYNPGDLATRRRWDDYQQAYAVALERCSTDAAPWYVVPADRKWYRNWAVATLLREVLTDLDPQYPAPAFDLDVERRRVAAAD